MIITTPDHAHCPVLIDTVKAGKDAYVEKPLCARLEDAWAAHDVVLATPDRIVQVGTQRRSSRKFQAALDYVKTGALGPVCKIETAWNRNVPSWKRPVDMVKAEDVDWQQYQMYLPDAPFDPVKYRCWQLFYEHTTGLVGLLGSHMIDVALWFMDDPIPSSAVALGGVLSWKDGREISDTAEYVFEFPKGWILTFSSRLGSGPETDFEVFYGKERTLDSRDWISRPANNKRPADAADFQVPIPADAARVADRGRRRAARGELDRVPRHAQAAERAHCRGPGARDRVLHGPRGGADGEEGQVRRDVAEDRRGVTRRAERQFGMKVAGPNFSSGSEGVNLLYSSFANVAAPSSPACAFVMILIGMVCSRSVIGPFCVKASRNSGPESSAMFFGAMPPPM